MGVSFISASQACSNVNSEIPDGTTIEEARDATREAWNTDVFNKVQTSETNVTKLNQLYTALYFMHLLPTNKTGENPLWESEEPYYDDIFTFWDIVRRTVLSKFEVLEIADTSSSIVHSRPCFISFSLRTTKAFFAP